MNAVELYKSQKREALEDGRIFIVKFGATWCKPCRAIKHLCLEWQQCLGQRVVVREVDIDEEMDLYSYFKRKRVIRGVPALLAWIPTEEEASMEYHPDDSVCTGDPREVLAFFQRIAQCSVETGGGSRVSKDYPGAVGEGEGGMKNSE